MKIIAVFPIVAVLVACQSVSDVVPAGQDTYLVGATVRGGMSSDAEVTAISIRRANEFCVAKGRRFEIMNAANSGTQGWTPQQSQVMFRCVDAQIGSPL
ncbi:hypothetical protein [Janthinobacterium sp. TND4EL3]|jgi:hypothetical protein|uniref:hypothetical protein n=1 Tax=Janthinobacterium sp. TND4EL3 TaxID=1907311 RepID=UPI000970FD00|nr:hypothetical protein [Janthinobacterium sp. TND4EL3]